MPTSTMRRIVAISPFGNDAAAGHTIDDDEFYFDYLNARGEDFIFHAPRYSAERLIARRPEQASRVRPIPDHEPSWGRCREVARAIGVPSGAFVVFFGYTEKLALAFELAKAATPHSVSLVATNNFSSRRARSYGGFLRVFLWLIRPRLQRLVVHTEYERDLARRLARPFRPDVRVKKHHLMIGRRASVAADTRSERPVLAYFGPSKSEKPIEPVLELVRSDAMRRYDYRLYGLSRTDAEHVRHVVGERPGVEVHEGFQSREDYVGAFASASIVMLTHTRDFEGKLSGNLCDSIAYAVPFLGTRIEPHVEYLRRFGRIGMLEDMSPGGGWAERFLESVGGDQIISARAALLAAASEFTLDAVRADLDSVLGL